MHLHIKLIFADFDNESNNMVGEESAPFIYTYL